MKGFCTYLLLTVAVLGVSAACNKNGNGQDGEQEAVPVQLALSVGRTPETSTKGDPAAISEMSDGSQEARFRGMTGITILPFRATGTIQSDDQSIYHPSRMGDISQLVYENVITAGGYVDGVIRNSWAHLYPRGDVSLPGGTASVLAYGCAPLYPEEDAVRSQHLNGALSVSGLEDQVAPRRAGDIHFDPVRIVSDGLPEDGQTLADLLNAIFAPEARYTATFYYEDEGWHEETVSVDWNADIEDVVLRDCFLETINDGKFTPGSGRSVQYMINRLYSRLKAHVIQNIEPVEYLHSGEYFAAMKQEGGSAPLTWGDLYSGLRDVIVARIEALDGHGLTVTPADNSAALSDASLLDYPSSLGLPDGAAILRWNGNRFYPVENAGGDSTEGIAPVTSFCYPPRLWYFANTTLSTANTDKSGAYTSEKTDWTHVLDEYQYGKVVSGLTESVALDRQLRFSCGMLIVNLSATTDELPDGDDDSRTRVTLTDNAFPVTGVVIGSQQRLGFDFTPSGGTSLFLYDDCISGVQLPPTTSLSQESFRTFVSQTPVGKPVYLCLEFRNDSGHSFTGLDGIILPGSKFYLIGRIEPPGAQGSVFEQYHTTTVNCIVSSFENAFNAIPNLEQPYVAIGVQISVNWIQSIPGHIILA